ncbi:lactonase family protein [Pantoea sp. A4]|uniref:lactonase family protein n=1 Tax=Pantoea sp. A4 TaxID=1225184 RepID=UPI00037ECC8B|nr:beta-propeller fold lactonase family protein [Pantoea sp. A4]
MKKMVLAAAIGLAALSGTASAESLVYISNAGSGSVSAYQLDKAQAQLKLIGEYPTGDNTMPTVVSQDKKTLYVSVRSKPYHIGSWHINADGSLKHIGDTAVPDAMAYVSLDKTGRFLLASSYGGDLFAVYHIGSDAVPESAAVDVIHTGKRAHSIQTDPTNHFLYVPLLGADQVAQFRFDANSGKVTPNDPAFINIQRESQTGPRHFAFAPQKDANGEQNLYLLTEMAGNITRLSVNANGTLTEHETIVGLDPEIAKTMQRGEARPLTGDNDLPKSEKPRLWQADIHITPDGKFLYATERTSSHLSAFSISPQDGHLTFIESVKTEEQPRGFAIDNSGRFLIETGQKSDKLSLYAIDDRSGKLTLKQRIPSGKNANWVTFVE